MYQQLLRISFALGLVIALTACQTSPHHRIHNSVIDQPQTLQASSMRLLVLPLSVKVKEMSAAGIQDEVGEWTREANTHILESLQSGHPHNHRFELHKLGELSSEEDAIVEEHVALFDAVAGSALAHTMLPPVAKAWQPKVEHFDYTLGPGLAFLADKTGADKALIVFGEDVISTGGRKAAFIVAAAFGVGIPMGHSFMIAGLVDLKSGDILWMDYTFSAMDKTYRKRGHVDEVLTELFTDYPGIDSYLEGIRKP